MKRPHPDCLRPDQDLHDDWLYSYHETRLFDLHERRHRLGPRPRWWHFLARRRWDFDAFCLDASIAYHARAIDRLG